MHGLLLRLIVPVALLLANSFPSAQPTLAAACSMRGGFADLAAAIPQYAGTCLEDEHYNPDLGESFQHTTTGLFVWRSVDQWTTFSDGAHTWLLDPTGQVAVRNADERFPWEFNGDGFPLVGQPARAINGPCPVAPLNVLAVENFYGNLVQQLGGQCVSVITILQDPDADPHMFQPTANDVRAFQGVALVVENGLGYDDFADKIIAGLNSAPAVVRAGDVVGLGVGANPHVWYSAGYVDQITGAIRQQLKLLNPGAGAYYDTQGAALDQAFGTYRGLIQQIQQRYSAAPVGSTESIFVDMAYTLGLQLVSPAEFLQAITEGNDPTAQDLGRFQDQLKNHQVKVLVYNVQTITNLTEQLKAMAVQNNIPIVGVSETMPLGAQTFQGWQAAQLQQLAAALQKAAG